MGEPSRPEVPLGRRLATGRAWLMLYLSRQAARARRPHPRTSWPLLIGLLTLSAFASAAPPDRLAADALALLHAKRHVTLPHGERIAYADLGPRTGRTIVLIHGYADSSLGWTPLLPALDRSARLLLMDLRGHGASAKPECCYTRFDFAFDIRLLLDRLRIKSADVIGHSLGSIVAQTIAELWPERVGHLVLISSTGGTRAGCGSSALAAEGIASRMRAMVEGFRDPLDPDRPPLTDWYASPAPIPEAFLRLERRAGADIPARVWRAVLDEAIIGSDLQPLLPRIVAPTLLLWGEKDPIMGAADRCSLHEALPAARMRVFDGLGHNPHAEQPQLVADEINLFLAPAQ